MARQSNTSQVTMREVAKLAGVSTATVSRVLRHPEKVAENTRYRVNQAISTLNYHHAAPTILPVMDANTLLVVTDNQCAQVDDELLYQLNSEAYQAGYSIVRLYAENITVSLLEKLAISRQFCALLLFPLTPAVLALFRQSALWYLPKVLCQGFAANNTPPITAIGIDSLSAAFYAVNYLHQSGHTRIGCISTPQADYQTYHKTKGYLEALKRQGIVINPAYLVEASPTLHGGAQALSSLLTLAATPTAIFCHTDRQAIGALYQARKMAIKVPDQLAVIGFGDGELCRYCQPPLSSVGYPHLATKIMMALDEQIQCQTGIVNRQVECQLMLRQSTNQ